MTISRTVKNIPQFASWIALFGLFLYLALNCSPKTVVPSLNFDDGWIRAINYLSFSNFVPGRDYNFMYGPIDFVFRCIKQQPNEFLASCFFIFQYSATGWALWFYRKLYAPWSFVLFSVALIIAGFAIHGDRRTPAVDEYVPLLTLIMLLSVSKKVTGKTMIFSVILSAFFAGLTSFIKFDLTMLIAASLLFNVMDSILIAPKHRNNSALIICLTYAVCSIAIAWNIFRGLANAMHWILTLLSISEAYKNFWGHDSPNKTLFFFSSAVVLIFIFLAVLAFKKKDQLASILLILMPSLLLGYLHGFIVEDLWHILCFLKYVLLATAILLLYSNRRIYLCVLIPLFLLTMQLIACGDSIEQSWWAQSDKASRLESLKLPREFFSHQIGENNTVFYDGVPSNMMWCFANDLPYKPNPILTSSLAACRVLDDRMTNYFIGNSAPDFIFCEFFAFAQKHMFFETPSTWRALLFGYNLDNYSDQKQVILLRKNLLRKLPLLSPISTFICQPHTWYPVPYSSGPLYCSLNLELTPLGKIYNLFKGPEADLVVKYRNGQIQRFRVAPAVSNSGILINYLPLDLAALKDLFLKRCENDVTEFELTGNGINFYKHPTNCLWLLDKHYTVKPDLKPDPSPQDKQICNDDHQRFSITNLSNDQILLKNADNSSAARSLHALGGDPNTIIFSKEKDELIEFSYSVLDNQTLDSAELVFLQIDQSPMIKMSSRRLLYDEAGLMQTREMLTGGFTLAIKASDIKNGLHTVTLIIEGTDGHFYRVKNANKFFVDN